MRLNILGSFSFVHITKEKQNKLDCKVTPCILVGYNKSPRHYFMYDPLAKTLHCSRDGIFREEMT